MRALVATRATMWSQAPGLAGKRLAVAFVALTGFDLRPGVAAAVSGEGAADVVALLELPLRAAPNISLVRAGVDHFPRRSASSCHENSHGARWCKRRARRFLNRLIAVGEKFSNLDDFNKSLYVPWLRTAEGLVCRDYVRKHRDGLAFWVARDILNRLRAL
jgi:hypothetical protein